jgi:hypothetical protein
MDWIFRGFSNKGYYAFTGLLDWFFAVLDGFLSEIGSFKLILDLCFKNGHIKPQGELYSFKRHL